MEVQRELSEIIRTEIKDPRVAGAMISIVSVEVTPDLKYCKAFISVLGSSEAAAEAMIGLKTLSAISDVSWRTESISATRRRLPLCWISRSSMASICRD